MKIIRVAVGEISLTLMVGVGTSNSEHYQLTTNQNDKEIDIYSLERNNYLESEH